MEQEIELWEKNGPKGVLLNKFCCVAFENKGKYQGSTKLCVDVKGNEKLHTGFILGFRPRHWDMWDARKSKDANEIGRLYGCRAQQLTKKGVDVLDIELQVGLYRVVLCDGTFGDFTPEEVRDAINRMNRMVDDESSGSELIVWCGSDESYCQIVKRTNLEWKEDKVVKLVHRCLSSNKKFQISVISNVLNNVVMSMNRSVIKFRTSDSFTCPDSYSFRMNR